MSEAAYEYKKEYNRRRWRRLYGKERGKPLIIDGRKVPRVWNAPTQEEMNNPAFDAIKAAGKKLRAAEKKEKKKQDSSRE